MERISQKSGIPNDLIGVSGVHFVVLELARRGLVALPVKNCAAYDIIVVNQKGTRHANLQVKTSFGARDFWPMPKSSKVRKGSNDYCVFLRWSTNDYRYKGYLVASQEVRNEVKRAELVTRKKGQRPFGAFYVGKKE